MTSKIQKTMTVLMVLYTSLVAGAVMYHPDPRVPTEAQKAAALKLAYELNGSSMVRWGSIDLSGELLR